MTPEDVVLVPFYRGAVVFQEDYNYLMVELEFSSPFIEERLYLKKGEAIMTEQIEFSSPFIEERLYFYEAYGLRNYWNSSRPLLSRSGCI